jgi:uncharacterized repeat protein (TIGR03803 family)
MAALKKTPCFIRLCLSALLGLAATAALGQSGPPAHLSEATLHDFTGGADGFAPQLVSLAIDPSGALYGTTANGGGSNDAGTVFKLTPPGFGKSQWTETALYAFSGGADGGNPQSGLIFDSNGALYGTTQAGGANGTGTVFKLSPPVSPSTQWTLTTLFNSDSVVGSDLLGGLVFDSSGALYGTAAAGGANGYGTIFRLTPPVSPAANWTAAALYNFNGSDGSQPGSTLVMDSSGSLYGATRIGGPISGCLLRRSCGVVFKLTSSNCTPVSPNLWCESQLYAFSGGNDGGRLIGGVTMDIGGSLYGAAASGGGAGFGLIYKLSPPTPPSTQWTESTLYEFTGGQDGASPFGRLTMAGGAIYGTTAFGGIVGTGCAYAQGCGVIFRLAPPAAPSTQWSESTIYSFAGTTDGGNPLGGVVFGSRGFGFGAAIYGVSSNAGGFGGGSVYVLQCAKAAWEVFGGAQHAACVQ